MTLTEAKRLADKLIDNRPTIYTAEDRKEAIKLLQATNRGNKTQKAWDRLDRRLRALKDLLPYSHQVIARALED
jgi:hypothetical protein